MLRRIISVAAVVLATATTCSAGPADWAYLGKFATPNFGSGETIGVQRLASDSLGNLYLSVNAANPHQYIYKCVAPTTSMTTPTYTMVLNYPVMGNGFQGLTCDSANNLYVMGESGAVGTGALRKYDSAGNLVTSFGNAGVTTPTARLTGLAVLSNGTLLSTTFGNMFYTFDSTTGVESGPTTSPLANYVRDLAVKPDVGGNDVIFANQSGRCKQVTGGSVTNVAGYLTSVDWFTGASPAPVDSTWDVRAGITYFAKDDTVIFCNKANPSNGINNYAYVVNSATGNAVQVLGDGTNQSGTNQLGGASDATVITSGGVDYLYVATQWPAVQVYSKATTPAAAVSDWSIY